jgi:photosynthetic reaction center cytochrome c subunit
MKRVMLLLALAALSACEPGKKKTVQLGYRGLAEEVNYDVSSLPKIVAANRAPAPLPPASSPSPVVKWKNVQVLNDISANELNRTMAAMTEWVSPKQGCNYCHNQTDFGSDEKYPKVVARRMIEMTRHVNNEYKSHVQSTGVTCFSCHRGQNIPASGVWRFTNQDQWQRAYLDRSDIRVQSTTVAHTSANASSVKQAENTYALMIDVSSGLGVNCTFCHNTRSFATWQNAPPARITALYGFRMVRDLNTNFLSPLNGTFPKDQLGPHGDSPKLSCVTCHSGAYKPLLGAQMVKDYPAFWGSAEWTRGGVNDTNAVGYKDLRNRDSIVVDGAPRLAPEIIKPLPAPLRRGGAMR